MQLTIIYFPPNNNRPFPFPFPFPLQEIFPESPSPLPGLFSFLTFISSVSLLLVLCVSSGRMLPNECVAGRWGGGRFYTTPEPVRHYHRRGGEGGGEGGGGGGCCSKKEEKNRGGGRGRKAWIQTRPRFPPASPCGSVRTRSASVQVRNWSVNCVASKEERKRGRRPRWFRAKDEVGQGQAGVHPKHPLEEPTKLIVVVPSPPPLW